MLRLTLRSGRDGRYLARVVDRGGFPFVLDFGDQRIIEDVSQKLLHGFTMWRHGRLVTAPPGDPDMMPLLADFYAGEGLLVFLDEPNWQYREGMSLDDRFNQPYTDLSEITEETVEDDRTELAHIDIGLDHLYDASEPSDPEITLRDLIEPEELDEDDETVIG